jgi:hypothetical protein
VFKCIDKKSEHSIFLFTNWSLTLREELKLRVFEIRVPGRIFGAKRDEVTGELRKIHNEELNDPYCSPIIIIIRLIKSRRMRRAGHVACMGEKRIQGFGGET